MRRYSKEDITDNNEISEKDALKKGFSFESAKAFFIKLFTSNKSKPSRISEKIFDILPGEDEEYRGRSRGVKHGKKRTKREKKDNKTASWFKKSLFVAGNIRFTRLAAAIAVFIVVAMASGTIVLAAATDVFEKDMPIENEDLQPALKTIYIKDGEDIIVYQTMGGNVYGVLGSNDIKLNDNDIVTPLLTDDIYNRMIIEIKRAMDVTLDTIGGKKRITMYAGTVEDALIEAGIEYDEDDIVEPEPQTLLEEGTKIKVDKVEYKTETMEVVVEYETEYRDEPTVLKGMYAIPQKGKDGRAEVTYEVKYINGEEVSRKAIEEKMIKEPVTKVVLNGTGLKVAGSDDEEEQKVDVKNPDEQSTNPKVPGTSTSYVETVSCLVTAYTHTGSTTATGTWPRSTRTLENPGTCAVVPDTFPYGSLLYVTGYGYCIAEDTGGFRHDPTRWNQIDVFMNTVDECIAWGRRRDVKVYVIRYGR